MKEMICTFTGTRNTLSGAQNPASAPWLTFLAPIERAGEERTHRSDPNPADAIGIAFSVHCMDMPEIARDWVEKLTISSNPYLREQKNTK